MVDFLQSPTVVTSHSKKSRTRRIIFIAFLIVIGFFAVRTAAQILNTPKTVEEIVKQQERLTVDPQRGVLYYLKNFFQPTKVLEGELADRITLLLLGMGGEGHEGPYLTDTIILLQLKPSTKQVALISIPRDLAIKIPGHGVLRINTANSLGETAQPGEGAAYAAQVIGEALAIDIPYAVRVNFKGFEKLIDELGGLDIYVEKSFEDTSFPAENYAYRTVRFERGWEHMQGSRALDYVRSRHGTNNESSDFARARRQQQVLVALKNKLFSLATVVNPARLNRIFETLGSNVSTNIKLWELIRFASFTAHFKDAQPVTGVIEGGQDGLLKEAIVDGAFLLFPKNGSYKEIQRYVKNIFEPQKKTTAAEEAPRPALPPRIEIHNATWKVGLAAEWKQKLEERGIVVAAVGNALERPQAQSTVLTLNQNAETVATAASLARLLKVEATPLPQGEKGAALRASFSTPATDILVIVGQDAGEE